MKPYMSALDQRLLELDLDLRLLDSTYSLKLWYDHTAHLVQKAVRRHRARSETLQPDIRSFFDARPARALPPREQRATNEEGVTSPTVEPQRTQTEITAWTITTQRPPKSVERKLFVAPPKLPKQTQTRLVFIQHTKSAHIGFTTQTLQQQEQQQAAGCPTASSEAPLTRPVITSASTLTGTTTQRNRRRRSLRPPRPSSTSIQTRQNSPVTNTNPPIPPHHTPHASTSSNRHRPRP